MGCFSFMCNECEKPVLSTSFSGQKVKLFLLKDGKVLQDMEGEYDSYGRVFIAGTQDETVEHNLEESVHWDMPWSDVCDLMFTAKDNTGIAAIHSECFKTVPTIESKDDPNQGWGEPEDEEEE